MEKLRESKGELRMTKTEMAQALSIGWYMAGGLTLLCGSLPILHIVMGIAIATGTLRGSQGPEAEPIFGIFLALIGLVFVLVAYAIGASIVYAGHCITKRKHRVFLFVISGIVCMFAPFGTALGVITILALTRTDLSAEFDAPPNAAA